MKCCMAIGISNIFEMQLSKASSIDATGPKSIALGTAARTFGSVALVPVVFLVPVVELRLRFGKRLDGGGALAVSSIANCLW